MEDMVAKILRIIDATSARSLVVHDLLATVDADFNLGAGEISGNLKIAVDALPTF